MPLIKKCQHCLEEPSALPFLDMQERNDRKMKASKYLESLGVQNNEFMTAIATPIDVTTSKQICRFVSGALAKDLDDTSLLPFIAQAFCHEHGISTILAIDPLIYNGEINTLFLPIFDFLRKGDGKNTIIVEHNGYSAERVARNVLRILTNIPSILVKDVTYDFGKLEFRNKSGERLIVLNDNDYSKHTGIFDSFIEDKEDMGSVYDLNTDHIGKSFEIPETSEFIQVINPDDKFESLEKIYWKTGFQVWDNKMFDATKKEIEEYQKKPMVITKDTMCMTDKGLDQISIDERKRLVDHFKSHPSVK